jgi:predicted O-methyltransferase YrrM
MRHPNFIAFYVSFFKSSSYLELGLYQGETFTTICKQVPNCVGVDVKDNRIVKEGKFFECTTDEFFQQNEEKFDVIFIDADHRFESVKKDFENSLKCLNENGTIILHDTDPTELKYLHDGYCSDSYKMNDYLNSRDDISSITLPINTEGLTLVKRFNDRRVLKFT